LLTNINVLKLKDIILGKKTSNLKIVYQLIRTFNAVYSSVGDHYIVF